METRRVGDIWWEPINRIMEGYSGDLNMYADWEDALIWKREDFWYADVLDSVRESGFIRPLTVTEDEDGPYGYEFRDGHHRLAAAIDLGYSHVPVQMVDDRYTIAEDSGDWTYGQWVEEFNGGCVTTYDQKKVLDKALNYRVG